MKKRTTHSFLRLLLLAVFMGFATNMANSQVTVTAHGENLPGEGIAKLTDASLYSKWLDFSATSWVQFAYTTP